MKAMQPHGRQVLICGLDGVHRVHTELLRVSRLTDYVCFLGLFLEWCHLRGHAHARPS